MPYIYRYSPYSFFCVQNTPVLYMLKFVLGYKASLYIQVVELGEKIIVYSSKYIIVISVT